MTERKDDVVIPAEDLDMLLNMAQANLGAALVKFGPALVNSESFMARSRLVTKWLIATGQIKREDIARPELLTQ